MKWSTREARPEDIEGVKALFVAYQAWLDIDLCFQGFEQELADLPGKYVRPEGNLFVASHGPDLVGCIAIRPLSPGICEMKRLFVAEEHRGLGIGGALVRRALREGRKLGYLTMRLDTLARMDSAIALYESFGFKRIAPYCENPDPEAVFMERSLA